MADWQVPYLDLRVTDEAERAELLAAVERVLRHGRLILGPEVHQFEAGLAEYCRRGYAVGCASGTEALRLALRAAGIGPGDEVITTALSWIATANAIATVGAEPVFADINDDLNLDPVSVAGLIGPRTRALLPVHYAGRPADLIALDELAGQHRLWLIEDAAQSYGASLHGRPTGSFGDLSCFSMNPMKQLAACGEAGAVLADDAELRDRLESLRYNGMVDRERCDEPSQNGRLDTVQAALLLVRLARFDAVQARRLAVAARYQEGLADVVEVPLAGPGEVHAYYSYIIRTTARDRLSEHLLAAGIEVKVRNTILMPEQPAYRDRCRGDYRRAAAINPELLYLPIHEKLTDAQVDQVIGAVRGFFGR